MEKLDLNVERNRPEKQQYNKKFIEAFKATKQFAKLLKIRTFGVRANMGKNDWTVKDIAWGIWQTVKTITTATKDKID